MAQRVKRLPARWKTWVRSLRPGFDPWVRKIPWRRKWHSTPVLLPGKSHGRRSLVQATVHGIAKSRTRPSDFTFTLQTLHPVVQHWLARPYTISLNSCFSHISTDSPWALYIPRELSSKESACQRRICRRHKFDSWVGKIPWRRKWQPTPVFLPWESQGQKSLVGYCLQSHKELDTTEHTHTFHVPARCLYSNPPPDSPDLFPLLRISVLGSAAVTK